MLAFTAYCSASNAAGGPAVHYSLFVIDSNRVRQEADCHFLWNMTAADCLLIDCEARCNHFLK